MNKLNFNNIFLEAPIKQYKEFYKEHLLQIKDRDVILNELEQICNKFKSTQPNSTLIVYRVKEELEVKTNNFLTNNFKKELIVLYHKKLPDVKLKRNFPNENDSIFIQLLGAIAETTFQSRENNIQEWNYKTNFLITLYDCLMNYGLHPNIQKRNQITEKKFNLIIKHFYRTKTEQTDFKIMMNYEQFDNEFTNQYIKQKPIKIGGKLIPFKSISEVKITTTLLKEDEIELFAKKHNFKWTEKEKDKLTFINHSEDETENYHPNPFDERLNKKGINLLLIKETEQLQNNYPSSFKLYSAALAKFKKQDFERNVLDDLRLSLEILLKELFCNQKSLEKQISELGIYQKKRGATNETTNMFQKLLEYYTKYQNTYVKHNDKVQKEEIEFVIDLTTTFIKYLIKE